VTSLVAALHVEIPMVVWIGVLSEGVLPSCLVVLCLCLLGLSCRGAVVLVSLVVRGGVRL
jgi:hypothetical protein